MPEHTCAANVTGGLEKREQRRRAIVHRALADDRRARIVDELDHRPDGLDAQELAERLGLHPNTVRWHLGILSDANLVSSHPAARSTPGRPRIVYALRSDAEAAEHENYRLLATILTGSLAELADGLRRAADAGRAWGRYLLRRPPPGLPLTEAAQIGAIVTLLAQEGFRPEARDREIRMHQCPFRDLAESGSHIVCAVHRGLIAGALAELGSTLEVERLDPFVQPHLCVARLGQRPTSQAVEP